MGREEESDGGRRGKAIARASYLVNASFRRKVLQIPVVHARFLLSQRHARAGEQKEGGQDNGGGDKGGAGSSFSMRSGMELSHHHRHQARWAGAEAESKKEARRPRMQAWQQCLVPVQCV